VQAALCNASFYPLHDRKNPPSMLMNVYRASDDSWFLLSARAVEWPALAKGIGRPDLLTDPRFNDAAEAGSEFGTAHAILDEVFGAQPMAHWHEVFAQAGITFGRVRHLPTSSKIRSCGRTTSSFAGEAPAVIFTSTIRQPHSRSPALRRCRSARPGAWRAQRRGAQGAGVRHDRIDGLRVSGVIPKPARKPARRRS